MATSLAEPPSLQRQRHELLRALKHRAMTETLSTEVPSLHRGRIKRREVSPPQDIRGRRHGQPSKCAAGRKPGRPCTRHGGGWWDTPSFPFGRVLLQLFTRSGMHAAPLNKRDGAHFRRHGHPFSLHSLHESTLKDG
jgi:hypothetical protein